MLPDHLECSRDATHRFPGGPTRDGLPDARVHRCSCATPARALTREALASRPWTMWRYRELLPLADGEEPVSFGEGATPLLALARSAHGLGRDAVYVKDEGQNPTGSFKARGMSVAVTMAKRLGVPSLVAPSAGNAGGALAAYGARAGLAVRVYVPRDTPRILIDEMRDYGAEVDARRRIDRRSRAACGRVRARERRLQRCDFSRTVSRRGKEDDGIRAGRTARARSRHDRLSDGRRNRARCDVEGVCASSRSLGGSVPSGR